MQTDATVFDIGTPCTPLKNPQHEALNTHTHTQAHTSTPTDARAHTPHLLIFGSNIRCCVLPIADGGFHVHWRVVVPARNLHPEFSEVSVLVHLPYKTNRKYFRILLPKISRCGVSVCERQKKKNENVCLASRLIVQRAHAAVIQKTGRIWIRPDYCLWLVCRLLY